MAFNIPKGVIGPAAGLVVLAGLGFMYAEENGWFESTPPAPPAVQAPARAPAPPVPQATIAPAPEPAASVPQPAPADPFATLNAAPGNAAPGVPDPGGVPGETAVKQSAVQQQPDAPMPDPAKATAPVLRPGSPANAASPAANASAFDRQSAAIQAAQRELAEQNMLLSKLNNEAQIEEARARIARAKREQRAVEEAAQRATLLPPVASPAGAPPPSMPPSIATPPKPAAVPPPAASVVSIRRTPEGALGATIVFDGSKYDVVAGTALHAGWQVAAVEADRVRVERGAARGAAGGRTAIDVRFESAASASSDVVAAPLAPLPLTPGALR